MNVMQKQSVKTTEWLSQRKGNRLKESGSDKTECKHNALKELPVAWDGVTGTRVLWMVTPDIKCLEASTMEFKCVSGRYQGR